METPVINENVVRKYLLGELTNNERERVEECLLVNDEFFNRLTTLEDAVEDELIDQYVNGELTGRERETLERLFLSSAARREKLHLAKDLNEYASAVAAADAQTLAPVRDHPTRWWHTLLAFRNLSRPLVGVSVVLLIAMVSLTWLFFRTRKLESELRQLRAGEQSLPMEVEKLKEQLEQLRARDVELTANLRAAEEHRAGAELETAAALVRVERRGRETSDITGRTAANVPSSRADASVVALALSMTSVRGGEEAPVKVLDLSPGVSRVQLSLNLGNINPTDYDGFSVELKRRDETPVRRIDLRSRAGRKRLAVQLPANLLTDGEYVVELNGIFSRGQSEPVGTYLFRVTTRK
jgi:hypothetical protein